jgi:uncharacterized membrane protein
MKIFRVIIEAFYWLSIFLSPFIIGVGIGIFIYIRNEKLIWLSVVVGLIGMTFGIIFAERIRKKYGCSRYMSRILATSDIWPDKYPEKVEADNKEDDGKSNNSLAK